MDHPYDKASSEFIVTAPAKYQVVANGRLEEIRGFGRQRRPAGHPLGGIHAHRFLAELHRGGAVCFPALLGTAAGAPLETWLFPKDREAGAG